MTSSPRPGLAALSAYGLLAAGLLALASLSVPGSSLLNAVTPAELLTGTSPVDLPSLAFGGGLLAVGVAAVALGLVLLFARVS